MNASYGTVASWFGMLWLLHQLELGCETVSESPRSRMTSNAIASLGHGQRRVITSQKLENGEDLPPPPRPLISVCHHCVLGRRSMLVPLGSRPFAYDPEFYLIHSLGFPAACG